MPIHTEPCEPWPFNPECVKVPEGTTQETIDRWRRVATSTLFALSGRRWGPSCPYTVRPCKKSCLDAYHLAVNWAYGSPWIPYIDSSGNWRNASICGCKTDCGCSELCEVYLQGPVYGVDSVVVDGVTLDPLSYRVDGGNSLVRTDGGCWPDCSDLAAACGEPGSFCVTYTVGLPLDDAAIAAHSALVAHFLKGCGGGCGCALAQSRNVSRVSRQGVDMEFAEAASLYTEGRTGVALVDLWLQAVNPYQLTSPSRVFSIDRPRPRTTTWPPSM